MELVWDPLGLVGVPALLVGWALAWTIYRAAPERAINRRLALVLVAEGTTVGIAQGIGAFFGDPASRLGSYAVYMSTGMALFPLLLLFLATIDSPLSRPLRGRVATATLWTLVPIFFLSPAVLTHVFIDTSGGVPREHPAFIGKFLLGLMILFAYSLLVALTSFRAQPRGSASRHRAGAYLLAFGLHDLGWIVIFGLLLPYVWPTLPASLLSWLHPAVYTLNELLFLALLAYGMLRSQLFDIDLKIKWTIRRGTLVATFALAFVVVAEVAQNWLSDAYGYVAGGLAAAVLIVALRPLDRVASRVADVAMPHVQPTAAYEAYRKMEVYRATLEGAFQDGEVTPKEREMLRRLRESLGIPEADAAQLERDLANAASTG